MRTTSLRLLCLVLALLLSSFALAEGLPAEEEVSATQEPSDAAVGEFELSLSDVAGPEVDPGDVPQTPDECEPAVFANTLESEVPEEAAEPQQEETQAIPTQMIRVTKSAGTTLRLGVPYALDVKGGIRSVASSAKKVVEVSEDGTLTLKRTGKAKLTIKTGKGKTWTLTVTVADAPAPGDLRVASKSGRFTLKWDAAEFATGYLVQYSNDEKRWTKHAGLAADARSLDVTELVTGAIYFRVTALLGDAPGGTASTSALLPITDAKVICQEEFYTGPTNNLNVTWSACGGASAYEVYRADVPSEEYELLGTTTETWFADKRDPKKLYAYRVRPVCEGFDLPMSDPVTLWSGMSDNVLPPKKLKSKTGIILLVNKKAQVVTAYIPDSEGRYSIPLRHMICSTGRTYERTRNGTWKIEGRKSEWYTYPGPSGDTIRWPTRYRGSYYFHSPLYSRNHSIRGYTVKRLGERASAGCIRLKVTDARWVYKHCAKGTPVYICDGKSNKKLNKALRPKTVKVKGF